MTFVGVEVSAWMNTSPKDIGDREDMKGPSFSCASTLHRHEANVCRRNNGIVAFTKQTRSTFYANITCRNCPSFLAIGSLSDHLMKLYNDC